MRFFVLFLLFFFLFSSVLAVNQKIDINSAPIEELVKIINIGEARAKEIISLRPFYSIKDLERVKGIGEKTVKAIEEQGIAYVDPSLKKDIKVAITEEEKEKEINNNLQKEIGGKIDINSASLEDLTKIVNIGEARAKEIISLRPFYSIKDLERVKGIGEKTVKAIEEQGIAYVDSSLLKEEGLENKEALNVIDSSSFKTAKVESIPVNAISIAFAVSLFSAGAIYILKKSII